MASGFACADSRKNSLVRWPCPCRLHIATQNKCLALLLFKRFTFTGAPFLWELYQFFVASVGHPEYFAV